ncbi:hypothetical protein EDB81DRAFT_879946 [Dactylonectria macrodidyma]|uniref:Uncharacterized protein n=1 Tax=Dactylonectria macrodidyma TaxID=307937 RepID=A0A9P9FIE2_9HYPO|nr:hypothetical protein EDB81DRAFT_879946 [Dactylonectria macrodidyma]
MPSLSNQAPPGHISVSPLIYRPKTTMQQIASLLFLFIDIIVTLYRLAAIAKNALQDLAPQIYQNPRLLFAPANAAFAYFKRLSALQMMQLSTIACLMYRLPIRVAIILWDTLWATSSVLFRFWTWSINRPIQDAPSILHFWIMRILDIADILIFALIAFVVIFLISTLAILPMLSKENEEEELWESQDLALTVEAVAQPGLKAPTVTPASRKAAHDAREEERQREDLRYRKEQRLQAEQQERGRSTSGGNNQSRSVSFGSTVSTPDMARLQEELAVERFLNGKLQREVAELKTQVANLSQDMIDGEHPNAKRSGGRAYWSYTQLLARQREDCRQKDFYIKACQERGDEIQELNKQLQATRTKAKQDLEFLRRKLIVADAKAGEHTRLQQEFEIVQKRLGVSEERRRQASERQRAAEKTARRR